MELFADYNKNETDSSTSRHKQAEPWTVLLVDDDEQVHQITRLALSGFSFDGRPLQLISAFSAQEAKQVYHQHSNIALALVDVVMESEHAGLELVKYLRDEVQDKLIRVVLRTGQAGQAPEDVVIREYEIDDYKEKTELTIQKLKTLLYSMLRAYRDLCLIDEQKTGLKKVIESSAKVQNTTTLQTYASSVLEQLTSLLQLEKSAFYCVVKPRPDGEPSRALTLAATGDYVDCYNECVIEKLPEEVASRCQTVLEGRRSQHFGDAFVFYAHDEQGVDSLLYVNFHQVLSELDIQLLEIYMQNIGLTFENLNLMLDIRETSKELVYSLANAVEARSRETGAHVQRVSIFCEKLALLYGLSDEEANMIKHAAPLHDVGKVAVPDSILHKPGKLDATEWEEMKKHVDYGVEILERSKRCLIVKAKEIAAYHHEKWDGSGYPNALSGESIPVSGRIAALADVFDALGSKRSYKEPWSDDQIRQEIIGQKGKHFEPKLVDLLLDNWDEFVAVRQSLPD
ncbi:phosphodiesterase [Vibrio xuii]|nr:phosphodiesterase [Vibrio xuii]